MSRFLIGLDILTLALFAAAPVVLAVNIGTTASVMDLPADPANLTATAAAYNQVNLSWTNNSPNADVFTVERRTNPGSYVQIDTTPGNVAVYTDNAVNANTTYFYKVRAFIGGGGSNYSNEASTTTPIQPVPPVPSPVNNGGNTGGGGGTGFVPPPIVVLPLPTHPVPGQAVLDRIDWTRDGRLNITDLSVMLFYFGKQVAPYTRGDANGDGVVNIVDVSILLYYWTG